MAKTREVEVTEKRVETERIVPDTAAAALLQLLTESVRTWERTAQMMFGAAVA